MKVTWFANSGNSHSHDMRPCVRCGQSSFVTITLTNWSKGDPHPDDATPLCSTKCLNQILVGADIVPNLEMKWDAAFEFEVEGVNLTNTKDVPAAFMAGLEGYQKAYTPHENACPDCGFSPPCACATFNRRKRRTALNG